MVNLLTRKLEAFGFLAEADRDLLDKVAGGARLVQPRVDLIREGDTPGDVHLILEGFACRYKVLADGTRQIVAYLVPGDFCDLHVFILSAMDHSIATLTRCKVVDIPQYRIFELMNRPAILRALWWATLVDEAVLREWLVNLGARSAEERVAHLLCELLLRLRTIGLAEGHTYRLPVTQAELADTMGLSSVHINRVLQSLRAKGLIALKGHIITILDVDQLNAFSGFNPNYLHLAEQRGMEDLGG
jgi:CRP-like cAMP-binding protein